MRLVRTSVILGTAACTAALAVAPAASGKVFFARMGGRTVHAGQRVTSVILGCPGNPSCRAAVQGFPVGLRAVGRKNARTRWVARISASGRISFRVPRLATGRYRLVAYARSGTRRRLVQASNPFRIRR